MERRGYHHGNLREALIRAALSLIAEKGPAGFTFAEAARSAGVSPAAPYRHFRDRDELMADVARQGFARFEGMLARAWNDGLPDALTAFGQIGKAYLAFARTEPAYYSAMFESGLPLDAHPDLQQAGDRAFAILKAGGGGGVPPAAAGPEPAAADGGAASVVAGARDRRPVRPRRRRPAQAADVGRGSAGGGPPGLSRRPGAERPRLTGARAPIC